MALTVDEIAEILNSMRVENNHNVENFEKALTGISTKLELMADDNEATDLIKVYLAELKNLVDDKQNETNKRFSTLENILGNIVLTQSDIAKTSELRDLFHVFSATFDNFSSEFLGQKVVLENLGSELNKIADKTELQSMITGLNSGLADLDFGLNKSFKTMEDLFKNTVEKIEALGISEQVRTINSKIDSLSDYINLIPSKISFKSLEEKLAYFQEVLNSLREFVGENSAQENALISERFEKLEKDFQTVVTESDFADFRKDLGDFVQKIIDNSAVLNLDLSHNTEKLDEILSLINTMDGNFEKVQSFVEQGLNEFSQKISSEVKEHTNLFNQNSKQNYENIIGEINTLKAQLDLGLDNCNLNRKENFEKINSDLTTLAENLQILQNISVQKNQESLDKILKDINIAEEKIVENINTNAKNNFDDLNIALANLISEIHDIKSDFEQKNNNVSEDLSSAFASVKLSLENVVTSLGLLNDSLKGETEKNAETILANIDELCGRVGDLKDELSLVTTDCVSKVVDSVNEISAKVDGISDVVSVELKENLTVLKNEISTIYENIQSMHNEYSSTVENFKNSQISGVAEVSTNILSFREHVDELVSSLKSYIEELNSAAKSSKSLMDSKLTDKLLEIEGKLADSSAVYELKIGDIHDKLREFAQNLDNASASTEEKIMTSISEIGEIKQELLSNSDLLNEIKKSADDNSEKVLVTLQENLDGITQTLSELENATVDNICTSLNESLDIVENRFSVVVESLEKINGDNGLAGSLEEKFSALKQEIGLVNTDITDAISAEKEEVKRTFESIKIELEAFSSVDFDKFLEELKSAIEASFLNFSVDVNGELASSSESIMRLEQVYKETFNKIEAIEDCLSEKIQNDIELLNVTIETNAKNLQYTFEEKLDDYIEDLKKQFANILEDTRIVDAIGNLNDVLSTKMDTVLETQDTLSNDISTLGEDLRNEFATKVDDILDGQDNILKQANIVSAGVSTLGDDLKNYVQSACENTIDKYSPIQNKESMEALHQKIDMIVASGDHEEIINSLGEIEEKTNEISANLKDDISSLIARVDIIVSDDSLRSDLDTINDKLNLFDANSNVLKDALETLSNKVDIIANDNSLKVDVDTINDKLDLSDINNSDIKESLEILSNKVDIIAEDESLKSDFEMLNDKLDSFNESRDVLKDALEVLSTKIDIIAEDESIKSDLEVITDKLDSFDAKVLKDALDVLSTKVDVIVEDNSFDALYNKIDKFSETEGQVTEMLSALHQKVDVIAADSSIDTLCGKLDEFSETKDKVAEMLAALHQKVDVITMDSPDFDIEEEIDDIKGLIFEQRKYFEAASDEKANAIDKYLKDVLLKLDNVDMEKNSEDIKETIMNALVSLVDQISFVEETEEIKDFVEEKTDAINKSLIEVQNQLRQIANGEDDFAYSYTLQDVETDIAKLRMAITHLSGNDFESLSGDIRKIVNSVEGLESTLTQEQIVGLKGDIEKLNEDILSISSRTNKLLLTSDESYKALNDGLNNFSSLVCKLEARMNYLDNSEITARLEKKIENIQSMAVESANADKVFHQVMMYLGEWIDSTTENISSITEKTAEINAIKENVSAVVEKVSDIQQVKDSISELRSAVPEKEELLSELEEKFEQQETRIDRLEMKLEKILSTLEEKDDMVLNRKVDKIEKLLSRLGTNIEKLTSYVDED